MIGARSEKKEAEFGSNNVGKSLFVGDVETHACLPVFDQTETTLDKVMFSFFNTVSLELRNEVFIFVVDI